MPEWHDTTRPDAPPEPGFSTATGRGEVGLLVINAERIIQSANELAAGLLGIPLAELQGARLEVAPSFVGEATAMDTIAHFLLPTLTSGGEVSGARIPVTRPGQPLVLLRLDTARLPTRGEHLLVLTPVRTPTPEDSADAEALQRLEEERQRLEARLHTERAALKAIIESAPVGMALLRGPDLRFEIANRALQSYSPGIPLLGRPFAETAPEMPEALEILQQVQRDGRARTMTDLPLHIQRFPDAPPEQAYFTFSCVQADCGGHRDAVVAVIVETTKRVDALREQERAVDEANRSRARLQSVFDHMVDGICVWSADGCLQMLNRSAGEILGVEADELFGLPIEKFIRRLNPRQLDTTPVDPLENAFTRALAGEKVRLVDYVLFNQLLRHDLVLRLSAGPIHGDGGIVGAVTVLRDVSELRSLDVLKDQFLRVAAHELKTPVAIMKGYAMALQQSGDDLHPARRRMLDAISRGSDRIERIVQDLLDLSQSDARRLELVREPLDLAELVRGCVDRIAIREARHQFEVGGVSSVSVWGDRLRLTHVVNSLLDNATRYSPRGGTIQVVLDLKDDRVVVSVRDEGIGIPPEKQGRIFERFYRAHTDTPYDFGGMGVGLYLSRTIVEAHGGHMWFESQPERGSVFSFDLPLGASHASG
jgi:PAS domain S-box-containing protein